MREELTKKLIDTALVDVSQIKTAEGGDVVLKSVYQLDTTKLLKNTKSLFFKSGGDQHTWEIMIKEL